MQERKMEDWKCGTRIYLVGNAGPKMQNEHQGMSLSRICRTAKCGTAGKCKGKCRNRTTKSHLRMDDPVRMHEEWRRGVRLKRTAYERCHSRRKNPRTPGREASRMLRGLLLRMKNFISSFFNVFKIFVKIFVHNEIYRHRCYLEFLIPACTTYTYMYTCA